MTTQQPEALRLAELLELAPEDGIEPQTAEDAAAELRRLHAENVRQPRPEQSTCGDSEMTNKQHPAQFDWATELLDAEGHVTLSAQEAHEIGARLRSMGEKLKAYEDIDEAASDVQLLRMGYAAARLEIESLQARIKTMAEEYADELMVAHMDGRMRGCSTEPAGEYPALPSNAFNIDPGSGGNIRGYSADQMRAYADATCAMRVAQTAGAQQPTTQPAPDEIINMAREQGLPETEIEGVFRVNADDLCRVAAAILAARPPADSVTAPAATVIKKGAERQWMSERLGHLPDGTYNLYLSPPTQPAPQQEAQEPVMWAMWRESTGWLAESCEKTRDECIANCIEAVVSEGLPPDFAATRGWIPRPLHASPTSQGDALDAARYRWLRDVGDPTWVPFRIRTGYSAAQVDDAIDAARKQGANHD